PARLPSHPPCKRTRALPVLPIRSKSFGIKVGWTFTNRAIAIDTKESKRRRYPTAGVTDADNGCVGIAFEDPHILNVILRILLPEKGCRRVLQSFIGRHERLL